MLKLALCALLCSVAVYSSGPCAPNEDMMKLLQVVHNLPSYAHLSADNKALLSELTAEAQSCQLTAYIYTVGMHRVLDLLDSLTPSEAHLLNLYLKNHLEFEHKLSILHPASTAKTTT